MAQASFKLSQLLDGITDVSPEQDYDIHALTLDSRDVVDGCLFVALKGTQQHGLAYALSAQEKGAAAVIWESEQSVELPELSIPLIEINDLRSHLGLVASRFYGSPSELMKMIGITGTDGKTSVSHFLAQANSNCAVIGTIGLGTLDNLQKATHTTPDVLSVHKYLSEMKQQGVETVAMEVSSHALDQGRVENVDFDVAVLTNLSRDHLDYHKTVEAYAEAKEKLFYWDSLKAIVVNLDDDFGLKIVRNRGGVFENILSDDKKQALQVIGYGVGCVDSYPQGALVATEAKFDHRGISATIQFGHQRGQLSASVLGRFNLSNLLAALGAMLALGDSLEDALSKLSKVQTVDGRMEKIASGESDFLTVVDFAHTPNALETVLKALREHAENKLVCVFGCGGDRDKGKRPLMAAIAEQNADLVIVTDDNPRTESPEGIMQDIVAGFKNPDAIVVEHDRAVAIQHAIKQAQKGDAILIAGKGHESVQILATGSIPFNDAEQASKVLRERAA